LEFGKQLTLKRSAVVIFGESRATHLVELQDFSWLKDDLTLRQ
jgi:hypothetical protein